jgi:hypothetical protein
MIFKADTIQYMMARRRDAAISAHREAHRPRALGFRGLAGEVWVSNAPKAPGWGGTVRRASY